MIISHKHKFIFIKLKKTAGTSLEIALSSICGEEDILTPITPKDELVRSKLGYRTAQNYKIPLSRYSVDDVYHSIKTRKFISFYNHMPAKNILDYINRDTWDQYYKFCFERNPFDKVVSLYYWRLDQSPNLYSSFYDFIQKGNLNRIVGFDMYSINGIVAVDKVFRYENLNESLDVISNKLNLDNTLSLPKHKAKSFSRPNKLHYSEVIDEKSKKIIEVAFAREIRLMNYNF